MPKEHENQVSQSDHQKSYSIDKRRSVYRSEAVSNHVPCIGSEGFAEVCLSTGGKQRESPTKNLKEARRALGLIV
jgi:hypothetical protein